MLLPLARCFLFEDAAPNWLTFMRVDAAYFHAMVLTAQTHFDLVLGRARYSGESNLAMRFLHTVQLLRQKLMFESAEAKISDPTAFVVFVLAMHSHIRGEFEAARHHME